MLKVDGSRSIMRDGLEKAETGDRECSTVIPYCLLHLCMYCKQTLTTFVLKYLLYGFFFFMVKNLGAQRASFSIAKTGEPTDYYKRFCFPKSQRFLFCKAAPCICRHPSGPIFSAPVDFGGKRN